MSMQHKGQIVTTDFLAATVIISLLLAFIFISWNQTVNESRDVENRKEITISAISLSDSLLKSKGDPDNWESGGKINNTLGLVIDDHVLDPNKLKAFAMLNQTSLKNLLGIQNYNFYFKVSDRNKIVNVDNTKIETGSHPNQSSSIVINSQRIALLNNMPVYLDFVVWR